MSAFPILLLDDEPQIADMLQRALGQEFPQASLIDFATLGDAVAYLDDPATRCRIRLVIVDIDLHSQHIGLDLIQILRQHQSCRLAPVLVLSSQVSQEWINQAYRNGVSAYSIKPDSYTEWKSYARLLRVYWHETVTTPR